MSLFSRARSTVVVLALLPVVGLPLGGSSAVAQSGGTCEDARCSPAGLVLRGKDNGARDDRLLANTIRQRAGQEVRLFRREGGEWIEVASGFLNAKGNFRFEVNDRNGRSRTKYLARVAATEDDYPLRATRKVR